MPTTIVSYNVNGIRAALNKGLAEWLHSQQIDILCVQETKALREQVDLDALQTMGYRSFWHSAEKKGYSGVATFSRREPDRVVEGCGIEAYDREGRILRTDFGDWTLLNCGYDRRRTTGRENGVSR